MTHCHLWSGLGGVEAEKTRQFGNFFESKLRVPVH